MTVDYVELVAEAAAVDVSGWDFSWLDGRATEERPPWGYAGKLAERMAGVDSSLDLQTGGGEVLSLATGIPRRAFATESYEPNIEKATALLGPRGITVVADTGEPPLPFPDGSFDLVTSRHPAVVHWHEMARVLAPGGTYLAQHVGPASAFELIEYFLGPQPGARQARDPDHEAAQAVAAGLEITDLRTARLRMEIHDVGAAIYLLRKVIWWVPGFTVEQYADRLRNLHDDIQRNGPFIAHSTRHLIEARKPA
ncbi:class I SAM-dependent methyltransferase [Arthrobacter sp.]|uniref:class I SAM-dependent methyltransferase n=1 Tax=Arthrobacter sp. TaxID=1667 RepID=UPI003A949683